MTFFEAKNIHKKYAEHVALDDVSIEVNENEIFGLLGPNGAGKTTLIRIINQIIAPDSGEVFLNGKSFGHDIVASIGYLPEERGLYKKMKVGEQALYLAQLKGLSQKEAYDRLKTWFQKFGIESWWNKKVEELSKGMQQKIQFIITLVHEPKLLIFDEPFSGFDPINAEMLKQEILALKKKGSSIILSTHNMASVEELCDNIALINKSKVVLKGNVAEIKQAYKNNSYSLKIRNLTKNIEDIIPDDFHLCNKNVSSDLLTCTVTLPHDLSSNDLLEKVLPFGQICAFEEILPTMNEIFIRKVTEGNNQ